MTEEKEETRTKISDGGGSLGPEATKGSPLVTAGTIQGQESNTEKRRGFLSRLFESPEALKFREDMRRVERIRHHLSAEQSVENWPRTIEEAVARILSSMDQESKETLKALPKHRLILLHHGWGAGIRNSFGLWRGNTELLASCGYPFMHSDDASAKITEAVWEKLQDPDKTSSLSVRKDLSLKCPDENTIEIVPAFFASDLWAEHRERILRELNDIYASSLQRIKEKLGKRLEIMESARDPLAADEIAEES